MALEARINTLQQRHQRLECELVEMLKSPATSNETIADLKRQKLQLKDQIAVLEADPPLH